MLVLYRTCFPSAFGLMPVYTLNTHFDTLVARIMSTPTFLVPLSVILIRKVRSRRVPSYSDSPLPWVAGTRA